MNIPLDSDWNDIPARLEEEMTDAGKASRPKESKGGTFAPADINIIKEALYFYIDVANDLTADEQRHIANLLHRLGRIN